jgi:regulator of replication initiation timing
MKQLTEVGIKSNINYYNQLIENKQTELLRLEAQRNKLMNVVEGNFKSIKVLVEENEKLKQEVKQLKWRLHEQD